MRNVIVLILLAIWALTYSQNIFAQGSAENVTEANSEFSMLASSWDEAIAKFEGKLTDPDTSPKDMQLQEVYETLKTLRNQASSIAQQKIQAYNAQKSLLDTLGDAPSGTLEEESSVRRQRNDLTAEISRLDAQVKRSKLTVARLDEVLDRINELQNQRLRNRLLMRQTIPISTESMQTMQDNVLLQSQRFDAWWKVILIIVAVMIIISLSSPVAHYLNNILTQAGHIKIVKPLSSIRFSIVTIAALFVMLLRFNMVNLDELPIVDHALKVSASITLAVLLFFALAKFCFINPHNDINELGEHNRGYDWLWNIIRHSTRMVLLVIPFLSIFGYINLSLYLSFNIFTTILALLLFIALRDMVVYINKRALHKKTKENDEEALSPLTITIIEPILAILMIFFAMVFWGVTSEDVTSWLEKYENGIPIGDITINFSSIGSAIMLFFVLYLFTKVLQWFLSSRVFPYTNLNIGVRDAILAVSGYIGIIIAVITAMGAVGLDLSNLAIVAGALSVGIGFGLQAIFNNFVSGLILLFERPVKVGDWIVVGQNEGVIKKIRVRSTEIETFRNSSIIVPNSQLISETVTNWTLHDRVGRVDVQVGVAYGTDTDLVKRVLLETGKQHTQVRSYPSPQVIFTSFGESSLDFELRCFIRNIRDIFRVTSELRFAIDKAFKENGIEIPFPQRDLHIIRPKPAKPAKKEDTATPQTST